LLLLDPNKMRGFMLVGAMLVTVANAIPKPATSTADATTSRCQTTENKYCSRGTADCSS
jgi:hypothetical protein